MQSATERRQMILEYISDGIRGNVPIQRRHRTAGAGVRHDRGSAAHTQNGLRV